jgi:molybdenum cofactor cytidylyltransferase
VHVVNLTPKTTGFELSSTAILCHDVRNPVERSEVLARKGTRVSADQLRDLLGRGVLEIHVALADPDDVGEDEAATRIAGAVAGSAVRAEQAHFGQASLVSADRGMLRVDGTALDRVNCLDGVLLLTSEADRAVDAGTTLGVVKCAPLLLAASTLRAVEGVAQTNGAIVEIEPFQARRVALIAPAERLRGGAFDQARTALSDAIGWFGSSLDQVIPADATVLSLATAYAAACREGAELVLAAGASGTDPLDVVFEGLRQAGGEVVQIGIPAEPGTACWIGHLGPVPVLGLASCELFGRPGALDLLLPRLFTGEALDKELLRRLALGGLLMGPSRIVPYHSSHLAAK